MFGFIVVDPLQLSREEREKYRAVYCGLCRALGREYGFHTRLTLTYDLAFLVLLLSDVFGTEYARSEGRCPVKPTKQVFLCSEYTSYAADINILLAYYKLLDDVRDDRSAPASAKAVLLRKSAQAVRKKHPEVCEFIADKLRTLSEAEKNDVRQPDIPADLFGQIMGKIFSYPAHLYEDELYEFGYALGKAVYIMDAVVDLKKDIKHKRFNPLVSFTTEKGKNLLDILIGAVVEKYNVLPSGEDSVIIKNILFSGIWSAYYAGAGRKEP